MELGFDGLSDEDGPITSSTEASVERRPVAIARSLAIVAIPVALLVWGKVQLLQRGGGRIFPKLNTFSPLEQLSFFRTDLLVGLLLIPLLTLLLAKLLGRWRAVVLAVLSIAAIWFLAIEFQTHKAVGRFLSLQLIIDAIGFWRAEADIAGEYITADAVLKPLACSLAVIVAAWWASGSTRVRENNNVRWRQLLAKAGLPAGFVLAGILVGIAWMPWSKATAMHRGVTTALIQGFREYRDPKLEAELAALSPQQLHERFRQSTNTPVPLPQPAHFAAANGCDVVLIVLETAPAAVADTLSEKEMPYLAGLKQRAWVGQQHHSTFPYTSYAMWSILSSWYPSSANSNYPEYAPDRDYPGIMRSLKASGYATALYAPDMFTHKADGTMYERLGVDKRYYSYEHSAPHIANYGYESEPIEDIKRRDDMALQEMLRDITTWRQADKRFIAQFAPQLGHAPWPDATASGARSVLDRGRSTLIHQDLYIGQVIKHLESLGRLDKTIILVTGDHGIRSRREDPQFRAGMIDSYSYHVPMVLYCPSVLSKRQDIPYITSHIDISPSILDLLGVTVGRSTEQGAPLWDSRIANRTTYFLANSYLDADGFHTNGAYRMWRRGDDLVFRGNALRFETDDVIEDGVERNAVRDNLMMNSAIRRVWLNLAPPARTPLKVEVSRGNN